MISFLVQSAHAFLPPALIMGAAGAVMGFRGSGKGLAPLLRAAAAGAVIGCAAYVAFIGGPSRIVVQTIFQALALMTPLAALSAMLSGGALGSVRHRTKNVLFFLCMAAVTGHAVFTLSERISLMGISPASVLSTDLVLNLTGLAMGILLSGMLAPVVRFLCGATGAGATALVFCAILLVFVPFRLAEIMLGMMRLAWLRMTDGALFFVAVVTEHSTRQGLLLLLMVVGLALVFLWRELVDFRARVPPGKSVERRRQRGLFRRRLSWFHGAVLPALFLAAAFLYHDLYASRPPRLSTPVPVRADASGFVVFKTAEFADNLLHRYAYITESGKVVRFFIMNTFPDRIKLGVALDACLMCGDAGYIQKDGNLFCLACDVSIFIPSIGKEGGCNPIPLSHEITGDSVRISVAALEKGAGYFRAIQEIEARDPVNGETLTNTKAPYRYEYQGRTYFFCSQETWQRFREAPEKFIISGNGQPTGNQCPLPPLDKE